MNHRTIVATVATTLVLASLAFAEEGDNATKQAMKFAHKAPRGEKKLNEKIVEHFGKNHCSEGSKL